MKKEEGSRPGLQQNAAAPPASFLKFTENSSSILRFFLDPHSILEYNVDSYTNNMNAFHSPGSGYHSIPHSLR